MITVEHLTKRYGEVTAVDDLSFEIQKGHVYKHELSGYFHSLTAYIFGAFLLAFVGIGICVTIGRRKWNEAK